MIASRATLAGVGERETLQPPALAGPPTPTPDAHGQEADSDDRWDELPPPSETVSPDTAALRHPSLAEDPAETTGFWTMLPSGTLASSTPTTPSSLFRAATRPMDVGQRETLVAESEDIDS